MQANKALLGFGWAADALEGSQARAGAVDRAGRQRDTGDTAVLEAQIAVPYAYAELGAYGQALERYEGAIAAFEHERRRPRRVDQGDPRRQAASTAWSSRIRATRWAGSGTSATCRTCRTPRHLAQVLAQHEFQEALQELPRPALPATQPRGVARQAGRLQRHAGDAPQGLRRAPAGDPASASSRSASTRWRKRRDGVAAEIAKGEADGDGVAFADAKQLDLLERLKDVHDDRRQPGRRPRSGRRCATGSACVAGVLSWQLAQDAGRPASGTAKKELQRHRQRSSSEAQRRVAALAQAQKDEPARFERFAAAHRRDQPACSQVMIPRVAGLGREQRSEAQEHRRRRARRPAGTHRRLHHAGALRAGAAVRPRLRQTRSKTDGMRRTAKPCAAQSQPAARPASLCCSPRAALRVLDVPRRRQHARQRADAEDARQARGQRRQVDAARRRRRSQGDRRLSQVPRHRRRRRRSAPRRCAASATSRWTAPTPRAPTARPRARPTTRRRSRATRTS